MHGVGSQVVFPWWACARGPQTQSNPNSRGHRGAQEAMLSKTVPKDGSTESLLSTGLNNKVVKMGLALWGFRLHNNLHCANSKNKTSLKMSKSADAPLPTLHYNSGREITDKPRKNIL